MKKLLFTLILSFFTQQVSAAEFTVKLLTSGENGATMVMEPGYIKIAKGDVINFVPSDPSHNAESFAIPNGATPFNTPFGKATKVTFTVEGVYLYKCMPHLPLGMLGVVQVGQAVNAEEAKKAWEGVKPGIAMNKERMDGYMSQIK